LAKKSEAQKLRAQLLRERAKRRDIEHQIRAKTRKAKSKARKAKKAAAEELAKSPLKQLEQQLARERAERKEKQRILREKTIVAQQSSGIARARRSFSEGGGFAGISTRLQQRAELKAREKIGGFFRSSKASAGRSFGGLLQGGKKNEPIKSLLSSGHAIERHRTGERGVIKGSGIGRLDSGKLSKGNLKIGD